MPAYPAALLGGLEPAATPITLLLLLLVLPLLAAAVRSVLVLMLPAEAPPPPPSAAAAAAAAAVVGLLPSATSNGMALQLPCGWLAEAVLDRLAGVVGGVPPRGLLRMCKAARAVVSLAATATAAAAVAAAAAPAAALP
jgi:hypothetical protein